MPELFEQEEGEEEFDAKAAERQESHRLEGVAEAVDKTVSFPVLFGIELITSLFNRPAKREEKPTRKAGAGNEEHVS